MSIYKPTWLYIKQHNQTKLKYFGKTIFDPYQYNGSGKYWKYHCKTHGDDITTLWCKLFTDRNELMAFALKFSIENNIVESTEWANLKLENGIDGGNFSGAGKGRILTEAHKESISNGLKGRVRHELAGRPRGPRSEKCKQLLSEINKGNRRWHCGNQKTWAKEQPGPDWKPGWPKTF